MDATRTALVAILAILGFAVVLLLTVPRNGGDAHEPGGASPALIREPAPFLAQEGRSDDALDSGPVVLETPREVALPAAAPVEGASEAEQPRQAVRDEDVVAWLRRVLPDRFADLSYDEIRELADLDLRGADITDADLALLASLPNLKNLGLRGTDVGDEGLACLRGLDQLESLVLRGTHVTGAGLLNLPTENLTALHLCDSKVTGDDLVYLPPMPNLRILKLNFLDVEDEVVEILGAYPTLRHVELDQTGLTDEGLQRMLALNPALERIELRNTAVTADGAKELAAAYPECELVLDSGLPFVAQH